MKSMAVNCVSVDWPAAAGEIPAPPEAAEARAWINAVLPAPVGPTTAIALTTFADLLSGMAHTPLFPVFGLGRRQRQAPLLAYAGLSRPGSTVSRTERGAKRECVCWRKLNYEHERNTLPGQASARARERRAGIQGPL